MGRKTKARKFLRRYGVLITTVAMGGLSIVLFTGVQNTPQVVSSGAELPTKASPDDTAPAGKADSKRHAITIDITGTGAIDRVYAAYRVYPAPAKTHYEGLPWHLRLRSFDVNLVQVVLAVQHAPGTVRCSINVDGRHIHTDQVRVAHLSHGKPKKLDCSPRTRS